MIQKVFGVRDAKAVAFLQPFFSNSTGAAVRAFSDAVNEDGKSMIAKHPEDYNLYELADFNDATGEFIPCQPMKMLGCARDFVQQKPSFLQVSKESGKLVEMEEAIANGK